MTVDQRKRRILGLNGMELLLNDPLPMHSIHESLSVFLLLRFKGEAIVARVQTQLAWARKPGGPRYIPWPLPKAISASEQCTARVLLYKIQPRQSAETNREIFNETFQYEQIDVSFNNIVTLFDPTQYNFDAKTHIFSLGMTFWSQLQQSASMAASVELPVIAASAALVPDAPMRRASKRRQLTASDLILSNTDHGFSFDDFRVQDFVLVYFKELVPMLAQIEQKNRRSQTFAVRLETDLYDELVVVTSTVLEPIDESDD